MFRFFIAMQEKSIAQRARAAVQRSAKKEAGRSRDTTSNDGSSDFGQSSNTDGSQSRTTDGGNTTRSGYSESASTWGNHSKDSITEQFTQGENDDYSSSSSGSSRSGSGSSYSTSGSGSQSSRSGAYRSGVSTRSGSRGYHSGSQFSDDYSGRESLGVISVEKSPNGDDIVRATPGLTAAIDASDWRAVGQVADHLRDGVSSSQPSQFSGSNMSKDTCDELDEMIDKGNWSGIIDAASNMANDNGGVGSGSDDDLD